MLLPTQIARATENAYHENPRGVCEQGKWHWRFCTFIRVYNWCAQMSTKEKQNQDHVDTLEASIATLKQVRFDRLIPFDRWIAKFDVVILTID